MLSFRISLFRWFSANWSSRGFFFNLRHRLIIVSVDTMFHRKGWNYQGGNRVRVMVFNATFNNISVISWQSVLLLEETEVHGENHRSVVSYWPTISHNVISLMMIDTDCIGSCKFNYQAMTTTTDPPMGY